MRPKRIVLLALPILFACAPPTTDNTSERAKTIEELTRGAETHEGLLTLHVRPEKATVHAELPAPDEDGISLELLYVEGLLAGLGSNPVGLDRGQLGETRVLQLRRVGDRLLVQAPNFAFRATTDDPHEARAVEQSFARSVLWSTEVLAEETDGRFLVDLTGFVVRDAHESAARLKQRGQGSFTLDEKRSNFEPDATLVFPDNVELEATLTFATDRPGDLVEGVTPDANAVTLVQHHSLVRLPDEGYTPRRFDPQAGSFGINYLDYSRPLDAPLRQQWIARHRLEKTDPTAARSTVKDPIVYYVDRGAPEPVRQALVDGASWWAEAFDAAGFVDAFRVELLPEGAHPLDVRYHVIQWVHRRTRGWSYGGGVIDPRTGEFLKGHVSLGSLRVRQDIRIFEGLLGADHTGTGADDDPVELALARIRQLAAHEVGHTLGITHNFAASTYGGRASVMDYPAPWLRANDDGTIDSEGAYAVGLGSWDLHAIRYAYSQFSPGADEAHELDAILREGIDEGLLFVTDHDARPAGGAHPKAHLWDNGADATAELANVRRVRRIALDRFGLTNLAEGRPQAELQEVFVPVYLYHRYQTEAAVKLVGGLDYDYAVRGRSDGRARPLEPTLQRRALDEVLATVAPAFLDVDDATLERLLPPPFGHAGPDRERFDPRTAPAFDALGAAGSAAEMTLGLLLHPARCARLVDHHRRDPEQLGLAEVLDTTTDTIFTEPRTPRLRPIAHLTQRVLVDTLVDLASGEQTPHEVRVATEAKLHQLHGMLEDRDDPHAAVLAADLALYLEEREWTPRRTWTPIDLPPGSPIGQAGGGCSPARLRANGGAWPASAPRSPADLSSD